MLEKLISERCSVREYAEKNIPNEDLKKILMAGYLAPSWMNSQSRKFILIKDKKTKSLLSEISMHQKHIKTAEALIAIIADKNIWKKENFKNVLLNMGIPKDKHENIYRLPLYFPNSEEKVLIRAVEQAVIAMSFMLLQAKDLGIDSCVIGAIANETTEIDSELKVKVNKQLNLKDGEVLVSLLTLGYNKNPITEKIDKTKKRNPFNDIVSLEKMGQNLDF